MKRKLNVLEKSKEWENLVIGGLGKASWRRQRWALTMGRLQRNAQQRGMVTEEGHGEQREHWA